MTELLVAVAISGMVVTAVLKTFLWAAKMSKDCEDKGSAQATAMVTTARLTSIIRNASAISGVETNTGNWVMLTFPGGNSAKLAFNEIDGQLIYTPQGGDNVLIARQGISYNRKNEGISPPVFSYVGSGTNRLKDVLQVQYRVSDSTDDSNALNVGFSVCLRNSSL